MLRWVFFSMLGLFTASHAALAAECDNLNTDPTHTGHSLQYTGTSQIMPPDANKSTGWQCFFLNTGFVSEVIVTIVDVNGNPLLGFETTGVNVNRTYYLGQTVVSVGFKAPDNPNKSDLYAAYTIIFGQDEPAGQAAVACGSTNLCVEVKPNGNYRTGNPRNGPEKSGNLYGQAPSVAHTFSASCSEPEWCVVLDDEGHRWQGSIRNHNNNDDFPASP